MGSKAGQRLETSSVSWWIRFVLIGLLVTVFVQGTLCDVEPTESQCRPYIEKALKEQHIEADEKAFIETVNSELNSEQDELSPTDELTDSTEGSITKDDDDNDEDDGEVKGEGEDTDDGDESAKSENEGDETEEDIEAEGQDDDNEEEGATEKDESVEKVASESEKEDEEEGPVEEDSEVNTDTDDKEEEREDNANDVTDASDNDDDDSINRPIDIEVQDIQMDNTEDDSDGTNEEVDEEENQDKKQNEEEEQEKEEKEEATEEEKEDEKEETQEEQEEEKEETQEGEEEEKEETQEGEEEEKEETEGEEEEKQEETEEEKEEETEEKQEDEEESSTTVSESEIKKDEREIEKTDDDMDEKKDSEVEDDDKIKEEDASEDQDGDKKSDEVNEEVEKQEAEEVKAEGTAETEAEEDTEAPEEEELIKEVVIPENLRPRNHIDKILRLEDSAMETLLEKTIDTTLKGLKTLYDNAIKPLEILYRYRDLSNRHFGDPEIFSKPLILFMGPWSGGKSSTINYLLDNEFSHTSLRTGAEPSPAYFNILMHGEEEEVLDGTQLAADWTFSGLQKFGQSLLDRLKGIKMPNKLLEKVNIVEIPGILEIRKQVQRLFPFNDACQWFIDRADIIFLVYDPSKLDVGPETEAILDQLKGREYQTRIILNKADQVKPEELMRVQGTLIWNISPLMSSSEPPIMYSTSLWSLPYEIGAPIRLLQAQERAFLRDLREAIDKRVENKIASARRFAVRVRNHAKMVDCYLTTYYNHKTIFGNRKKVSDDIIEYPQKYHIYEGLSTLTNISRYDLPDPDVYKDFFKINPLYEFKKLSETCTYFRGCPINKLDVAIAYDLPELVGKYKKAVETAKEQLPKENS